MFIFFLDVKYEGVAKPYEPAPYKPPHKPGKHKTQFILKSLLEPNANNFSVHLAPAPYHPEPAYAPAPYAN